jgi:hypothetical protein
LGAFVMRHEDMIMTDGWITDLLLHQIHKIYNKHDMI